MSDQNMDAVAPLSDEDAAKLVAELPVWTRSVAELETWDAQRLYSATTEVIEREHGFHPAWAQRLDEVLTLKVAELISTRHSTLQDFRGLQLLIGLLANDEVREELNAMPAHYAARWQALSDAMAVVQNIRDFRAAAADQVSSGVHVWDRVTEHMSKVGSGGASWQQLAEVIKASPDGPKSKGGISQLLTAMQGKGLLDSVQRGRCKFYMAGPAMHKGSASQPRLQPGSAVIPRMFEEAPDRLTVSVEQSDARKVFKNRFPLGVLPAALAKKNQEPTASRERRKSSAGSEK